ncbi:hypothetical protein EKD16_20250 [Streptomonospora litoralis]|uniref:Uncharacterized protein n=1 Tax=Streptomonospora litoralis TaxID=2498135 RepID=A0A4V0ZK56_9ACTN|nr:hypothetical protein EKD16_20250 [Streptomonospora litoralis]
MSVLPGLVGAFVRKLRKNGFWFGNFHTTAAGAHRVRDSPQQPPTRPQAAGSAGSQPPARSAASTSATDSPTVRPSVSSTNSASAGSS